MSAGMTNEECGMMNGELALRAVLRGVQCVCEQWWPDYVMRGGLAHMECCGAVYEVRPSSAGVVLSLRDGMHGGTEGQAGSLCHGGEQAGSLCHEEKGGAA
jgi:hypothetical protein